MCFSFPAICQHWVLLLKIYVVHVMGVKCYLDAVNFLNICFLRKFLLCELFVSFLLRMCMHLVHKHTITLLSVKFLIVFFLNVSYNFLFFFFHETGLFIFFVAEPALVYLCGFFGSFKAGSCESFSREQMNSSVS